MPVSGGEEKQSIQVELPDVTLVCDGEEKHAIQVKLPDVTLVSEGEGEEPRNTDPGCRNG